jgi:hypothetical protein
MERLSGDAVAGGRRRTDGAGRIGRPPQGGRMKFRTRLTVLLNVGVAMLAVTAFVSGGVAHATNFGVTISNRGSGKCLTVPNASTTSGTAIVQWICDTDDVRGQHWAFEGQSGTAFRQVLSLDTGLCMDATGFGNGNPVVQTSCGTGDAGLFWTITDLQPPTSTSRLIRLQSSEATSVCLDLSNGDIHNGVPMQVWQCNANTDNQKWNVFTPTS